MAGRKSASIKAPKTVVARNAIEGSVMLATAADVVDEQLAKYRSMRDFHITEEPAGAAKDGTAAALPFCIQKHAASHLHYDFRLGWNGVLKSWAVAKGPSYFPGDKRLAVQVEDHPMEYGGFEGIIPGGQYGGGTVMLWDQGTWEPQAGHEDVNAGLWDGSLKFVMHGEKIKGKWTLVRMGGKAATERKPNWLLIKEHDEFERGKDAPCVTEAEPLSVVTERTMEQIAQNEDHVWNSKETAGTGQAWYRSVGSAAEKDEVGAAARRDRADGEERVSLRRGRKQAGPSTTLRSGRDDTAGGKQSNNRAIDGDWRKALNGLPREMQPTFLKPQLALEATTPPTDGGWLHELKLDGYRIQARKSKGAVQLLTRSGLDWTYRVPAVAEAVARLAPEAMTLDGEVVVLASDGTTNFADLQASFQEGASNPLTYFCFDLLHLEGRSTRELSLLRRKEMLAEVLTGGDGDSVRLSEHIVTSGEVMFKHACELHAEGIVSKRLEEPYKSGRSGDWLKSKCLREQEFVVGGYTLSSDGDDRIGSLLLGYYRNGALVYAGRTGTGFTQKMRRSLLEQLKPMQMAKPAYERVPAEAKRGAVWVRPELVAQVRFATWTAEDLVRQAAFLGLREDKAASEVRREEATVAPKPKAERRTAGAQKARSGKDGAQEAEAPKVAEKFPVRPRRPEAAVAKPAVSAATAGVRTAAKAVSWDTVAKPPIRLTHPAKVLDVESGVTKQVLADYLWAVADRMLPHIANRPLSLVRCPEGSVKPCFYQKHVNHMLPPGVGSVDVPDKKTGVVEPYITLPGLPDGKEALAALAQMGVLEVHPWGSTNEDLEHADRVIFDLDPDESLAWRDVTTAADEVRKRLKARGLESFLKTTGGKGLHVVVPTEAAFDWTTVKEWAHSFVLEMERAAPTKYLSRMTKAARVGKIYLDYLRNERGATAVAPYSSRARAGLGVSMPLAWSELHAETRPVFRVDGFPEWKGRLKKDPWAKIGTLQQQLK
jgi:bifunctional non-homologous end joining protein LigD